MMQTNRTEYEAKIQELKAQFERDGYNVLVEPQRTALPFDLDNYVPDIVASKPDGGLIVEVKTTNTRTSISRYQSVAQIVQQHPGWRFLMVTVDDLNVPEAQEMASWNQLEAKLDAARSLIAEGKTEPATLYLWAVFEAAMRKLAYAVAMPIERLPATTLMNQLYTAGYISIDDFQTAKKFQTMRNRITHGFGTSPDGPLLESFLISASGLIQDWKNERIDSEMLNG